MALDYAVAVGGSYYLQAGSLGWTGPFVLLAALVPLAHIAASFGLPRVL